MFSLSHPRILATLILILYCFLCTGCSAPAGNPDDGKRWYMMNNCSACHGLHGNDGRAVNIAGLKMGFGSFVRKLRKSNASIMPPFPETKVSEQDAADIYAYLKSMPPPEAR
ncbi:MAG: cytochrome c [Desulforhopalus sp.]